MEGIIKKKQVRKIEDSVYQTHVSGHGVRDVSESLELNESRHEINDTQRSNTKINLFIYLY